jgi:hypothetical protein
MMLSNRSKGVAPPRSSPDGMTKVDCFGLLIIFSASRVPDALGSGSNRGVIRLPRQLLIGQASASDGGQDFREAIPVIALAFVVAERLLIQIAEQMEGLDADVGSFQAALQQRPEILDPVRVDVAVNVLFRVVHELVNVVRIEAGIGRQFIGEDFRARFDICAHFLLQGLALAIRHMLDAHFAGLAIQQAHDQFFARAASASDLRFLVLMHEARESADESLVRFDWTAPAEFREGAALHREADAVKHEPSGFLADFQIASQFARTDSVLAITDQPNSRKPFCQRQRRVLEDRSNLHAKLTAGMFLAALPAPLVGEIMDLSAVANGASYDAIRPTARDHVRDAAILIGIVTDRINQGVGSVIVRVHALNLVQGRGLVKSIFAQIRGLCGPGSIGRFSPWSAIVNAKNLERWECYELSA